MNAASIIIDIVVVLIILCSTVSCAKQGFVKKVLLFAGFLVSLFGAIFISKAATGFIYTSFVQQPVETFLQSNIGTAPQNAAEVASSFEAAVSSMPEFVANGIKEFFGLDIQQQASSLLGESLQNAPHILADKFVKPVASSIIQVVLFTLLFVILSFIMRRFARILGRRWHIPVLGQVNTILGGTLGALEGFLLIFVFAVIVQLINIFTSYQIAFLNSETIEATYLFKYFYNFIPLHSFVPNMPV